MSERTCAQCGGPLPANGRADRSFCSNKCAQLARRARANAGRTDRACLSCGAVIAATVRKDKKYCSIKCYSAGNRTKIKRQNEIRKRKNAPPVKPIPIADAARILSANFWLPDLRDELASLHGSKHEVESALRAILAAPFVWPNTAAGRAALVLFLLNNPGALPDGVKPRHLHDKIFRAGVHAQSRIDGRQT